MDTEDLFEREKERLVDWALIDFNRICPNDPLTMARVTAEAYISGMKYGYELWLKLRLDDGHAFAILDEDSDLLEFLTVRAIQEKMNEPRDD